MIKTLIIEDEFNAREILKKLLLHAFADIEIVGETSSVSDSISFLKSNSIDLAIMDIELDDGNSFDILKNIDKLNFQIVFTTAYNKYALRAFKFNAIDYLLKPIDPIELVSAINKAISAIEKEINYKELLEISSKKENQKIKIKTAHQTYIMHVSDIIRVEAEGAYSNIITINQRILISKNLRFYEDLLNDYNFIRVHQSHLINFSKIIKVKSNSVLMNNKDIVPVSSRKKKRLKNKLQ